MFASMLIHSLLVVLKNGEKSIPETAVPNGPITAVGRFWRVHDYDALTA